MHPEFIELGGITIHTYGFMIMIGAILGYIYLSQTAKRELGISPEKIQNLAIMLILAAFIGGKFLFYLEKPSYYFHPPSNMFKNFRTGFVFYGSLLFAIPTVVWYFRKNKWPLWPMLDRISITACIVHACGRLGCFFAGCCYGLPTAGGWGLTFTDPISQAEPLNTPLHPTQLYEFFMISGIGLTLFMLKRYKRLEGRLIFVYISLYAIGRSITEMFRGDVRRGFIIEGMLSHSQFISILIVLGSVAAYFLLYKREDKSHSGKK